MSGGDSGGGSQSSRPLTAAERSELFDAAIYKMGATMPKASDYQGYEIIDPSADRGRGLMRNFSTGYDGYSNIAPRTVADRGDNYYGAMQSSLQSQGKDQQNAMAAYLDEYFKRRDASTSSGYDVALYGS